MRRTMMLGLAATVLAVSQASAAVQLVNVDWDANTPTANYGYSYKIGGGGLPMTNGVIDGAGVGASKAYVANADSTDAPQGAGVYWGSAATLEHEPLYDLTGATAATDLGYSIDVFLEGYLASRTTASIRMEISFIDTAPTPDVTLYRGRLSTNWLVTPGGFQTFAGDFSTLTPQGGTILQNAIDAAKPLRVKVALEIPSGHSQFGFDTNNIIAIDNVIVTAPNPIPEPTAMALLGVAGLGLMRRCRR